MGVSFKVSKKGTRFRPKVIQIDKILEECSHDSNKESLNSPVVDYKDLASIKNPEDDAIETGEDAAGISGSSSCSGGHITSIESEVSFSLNLYHDGYYIGKPSESSAQDGPKSLHPYDRTSETLFSAIESGRLPGDILDDIPSKYIDGMLVCEVRDYRKSASEPGSGVSSADQSPVVNRISLRMSLENVVKDMPLISDDSWTYSDLMEVESRIVKAMQPHLCLDPTPMLDRLCGNPVGTKLNLGLCGLRKRRLRMIPEVTITSNNQIHGKKVCVDKVQETSNCRSGDSGNLSGDTPAQPIHESMNAQHVLSNSLPLRSKGLNTENSTMSMSLISKHHQGNGYSRALQDHYPGSAINPAGISSSGRDSTVSYNDTMDFNLSSVHGRRENQDAPITPSSKRARQALGGSEGIQRLHPGSQLDSLPDISWNNSGMHTDPRGSQYTSLGGHKYTQKVLEGAPNQDASASLFNFEHQGTRYAIKDEQAEPEKMDKTERNRNNFHMLEPDNSQLDPQQSRLQQRVPQHPSTRSHFPQMQWNNLGQPVDSDPRKEDQLSKRKLAQSPRVSSGPVVQSPVSSKSGEFSSGSFGQHFNSVAAPTTFGPSQKEKGGAISGSTVGGPPSVTSSPSDSMPRQHQGQMSIKRRSNSVPRTPVMSGVGSPASVSNMIVSMNASSPSISTPPLGDQNILERFSKIDMVAQRHLLHSKKNKVDNKFAMKQVSHSRQELLSHLSNAPNNEEVIDTTCKTPLSKSFISGSMNVCKIRALTFIQTERKVQGNAVSVVTKARNKLIMSEKQNDGTVAMLYGDVDDDVDLLSVEDYLPTLPNTHQADLLAAQFYSLMIGEDYKVAEDLIRPKQTLTFTSNGQSNPHANPSNGSTADMQQPETNSGPASSAVTSVFSSGNASLNTTQNNQNNTWAVPPGSQTLQISQGPMSGAARPITSQQMDSQQSIQQQQHQQQSQHALIQQHAQRGSLVSSASQLSHLNPVGQNSNVQLGNHMVSKPSHPQFQLIQQQQQQQQHQQQQQQQQQQQHQQQQPLQQSQMQRKMMMGLGTAMNMGNMGNNVVGLGGLNVLGMGGVRGIGGPGIAASMGSVSSISNMGQNPMNASNVSNLISQQIRNGNLTHAQATALTRLRMVQSRGGMLGTPQSGIGGMSGTGQMHPSSAGLSMLGQTLNRANINPMQRANIASMGPPKIPGTNFYMNQQQQLQLQHQQQQLQQQQQHVQQQQQISSPLQAVVSPSQVGSPSAMAIPQQLQQQQQFSPQQLQQQQQFSPQQLNQHSPMSPRLSSGTLPPLNAAAAVGTPASPQLSSQTLGSVGSITSSSMELQGMSKSNSAGNM